MPPAAGKDKLELRLHSPAPNVEAVVYAWPLQVNDTVNEATEIVETIKWVCRDFPELRPAMQNYVFSEIDSKDFEKMKALCDKYNRSIDHVKRLWAGQMPPKCLNTRATPDLVRHIFQQVYNHSVVDPEKLNLYEPFSPEVYGETSFELVNKIIEKVVIKPSDSFIDLGSGVGNVVLHVAAMVQCDRIIGVEKAERPAAYAREMEAQFRKWMKWYGKIFTPFTLTEGDFLIDDFKDKIITSSFIFANNFAFGPNVNHKLKERFAQLEEGTRVVSSREFCPVNFRITKRNLSDIGTILSVIELESIQGAVSWTDKPVSYYLHTVDRKRLEKYFHAQKYGSVEGSGEESGSDTGRLLSLGPSVMETLCKEANADDVYTEGNSDNEDLFGACTRRQWKMRLDAVKESKRMAKKPVVVNCKEQVPINMTKNGKKVKVIQLTANSTTTSSGSPSPSHGGVNGNSTAEHTQPLAKWSNAQPPIDQVRQRKKREQAQQKRRTDRLHQKVQQQRKLQNRRASTRQPTSPIKHVRSPTLSLSGSMEGVPGYPVAMKSPPVGTAVSDSSVKALDDMLGEMRKQFMHFLQFSRPNSLFEAQALLERHRTHQQHLKSRMAQLEQQVSGLKSKGYVLLQKRLEEMRLSKPVEVKAQLAAAGCKHSELVARLASLEKELAASATKTPEEPSTVVSSASDPVTNADKAGPETTMLTSVSSDTACVRDGEQRQSSSPVTTGTSSPVKPEQSSSAIASEEASKVAGEPSTDTYTTLESAPLPEAAVTDDIQDSVLPATPGTPLSPADDDSNDVALSAAQPATCVAAGIVSNTSTVRQESASPVAKSLAGVSNSPVVDRTAMIPLKKRQWLWQSHASPETVSSSSSLAPSASHQVVSSLAACNVASTAIPPSVSYTTSSSGVSHTAETRTSTPTNPVASQLTESSVTSPMAAASISSGRVSSDLSVDSTTQPLWTPTPLSSIPVTKAACTTTSSPSAGLPPAAPPKDGSAEAKRAEEIAVQVCSHLNLALPPPWVPFVEVFLPEGHTIFSTLTYEEKQTTIRQARRRHFELKTQMEENERRKSKKNTAALSNDSRTTTSSVGNLPRCSEAPVPSRAPTFDRDVLALAVAKAKTAAAALPAVRGGLLAGMSAHLPGMGIHSQSQFPLGLNVPLNSGVLNTLPVSSMLSAEKARTLPGLAPAAGLPVASPMLSGKVDIQALSVDQDLLKSALKRVRSASESRFGPVTEISHTPSETVSGPEQPKCTPPSVDAVKEIPSVIRSDCVSSFIASTPLSREAIKDLPTSRRSDCVSKYIATMSSGTPPPPPIASGCGMSCSSTESSPTSADHSHSKPPGPPPGPPPRRQHHHHPGKATTNHGHHHHHHHSADRRCRGRTAAAATAKSAAYPTAGESLDLCTSDDVDSRAVSMSAADAVDSSREDLLKLIGRNASDACPVQEDSSATSVHSNEMSMVSASPALAAAVAKDPVAAADNDDDTPDADEAEDVATQQSETSACSEVRLLDIHASDADDIEDEKEVGVAKQLCATSPKEKAALQCSTEPPKVGMSAASSYAVVTDDNEASSSYAVATDDNDASTTKSAAGNSSHSLTHSSASTRDGAPESDCPNVQTARSVPVAKSPEHLEPSDETTLEKRSHFGSNSSVRLAGMEESGVETCSQSAASVGTAGTVRQLPASVDGTKSDKKATPQLAPGPIGIFTTSGRITRQRGSHASSVSDTSLVTYSDSESESDVAPFTSPMSPAPGGEDDDDNDIDDDDDHIHKDLEIDDGDEGVHRAQTRLSPTSVHPASSGKASDAYCDRKAHDRNGASHASPSRERPELLVSSNRRQRFDCSNQRDKKGGRRSKRLSPKDSEDNEPPRKKPCVVTGALVVHLSASRTENTARAVVANQNSQPCEKSVSLNGYNADGRTSTSRSTSPRRRVSPSFSQESEGLQFSKSRRRVQATSVEGGGMPNGISTNSSRTLVSRDSLYSGRGSKTGSQSRSPSPAHQRSRSGSPLYTLRSSNGTISPRKSSPSEGGCFYPSRQLRSSASPKRHMSKSPSRRISARARSPRDASPVGCSKSHGKHRRKSRHRKASC